MRGIGKMIKEKDGEYTTEKMVINMKVIGKMIKEKEKELKFIKI